MRKYIDADKLWNRLISVSENDWVGFDTIDEVLSGMPAADVAEVRHGRWEQVGDNTYRCSVCGEISCCNSPFCSECGANMVSEDE